MRKLKWLYPGMRIKRWIALIVFGVSMLSVGFVLMVVYRGASSNSEAGAGVVIMIGLFAIIIGIRKMIKNLLNIFLPEKREKELVDLIYRRRYLEKGPRIVVFGGGIGLYNLLSGLKEYSSNITALITLTDDEGVIGKLQKNSMELQPNDIKNSIVALADAGSIVNTLFNFKFRDMTELWGYDFGNIFLTAVSKITGNLEDAIKESSHVLGTRGNVVLTSLEKLMLVAEYTDGRTIYSKKEILKQNGQIARMWFKPAACTLNKEARDAIRRADIIILGPGSLYTSVIPGVLIDGVPELIDRSRAVKIFVCNTMSQPGQTEDYTASDHIKTLIRYAGDRKIVDYCLVHSGKVNQSVLSRYELEGSSPVTPDHAAIRELGIKDVEYDFMKRDGDDAKHEVRALTKAIVDLVIHVRTKGKSG